MQANAFLPCALIQLAKASSAEKTVAVNHAETAHTHRDAASTRPSVYPVPAKAENAELTAAAGHAAHVLKDKDARSKESAKSAHAKAKNAAMTAAVIRAQ